jgi:hypothetical protein
LRVYQEIMTGKPPFHHFTQAALILAVCIRGERPVPLFEEAESDSGKEAVQNAPGSQGVRDTVENGEGDRIEEAEGIAEDNITDELWELITECWAKDPSSRPAMLEVLKKLTVSCAAEKPLRLLSIGQLPLITI